MSLNADGKNCNGCGNVCPMQTPACSKGVCGLTFRISPASFFQVNPLQAENLYNKALEMADVQPNETVLDAYCGVGTLSLIFAKKARKVIGVECVPEAIEDRVSGLLVRPKSARELAGAVIELLENPTRAQVLGQAARERVLGHFQVDRMAEQTMALYEQLLTSGRASHRF